MCKSASFRTSSRAKRFVEAGDMAAEVELELETAPGLYAKGDPARAKTDLDPIIAQCEAALAAGAGGRSGKGEPNR